MPEEKRIVEVLKDGGWEKLPSLSEIKKGDVFRMSEPDGTPVIVQERKIFKAKADSELNNKGLTVVEMEVYLQ